MAVERKWLAVTATPFTSNGTALGVVTVADTAGFKVKQLIFIAATGQNILQLQVKRVISTTQLIIGPVDNKIATNNFTDISAYTVARAASIAAPEQDKQAIPPKDDHYSAVYEADPTVADRVIMVDQYGKFYGHTNPLPITFDGTITVGEVEVVGTNGNHVEPNADGSLNVNVVQTPVTGQVVMSMYAEVLLIPSGATTTLISYTVPVGKTSMLQRADVSGDNIARYDVTINGVTFDTRRSMYGSSLNTEFDWTTGNNNGFLLNSSDVVILKVLHNRPSTGTFNARLQVLEIA